MNAMLLWFACAAVAAMAAPRLFNWLMLRADPRILLISWLGAVVGSLAGLIIPAVIAILPGHGGVSALSAVAHTCWLLLHGDAPLWIELAFAALGAIVLALWVVRWPVHLLRSRRQRKSTHRQHLTIARILHGSHPIEPGTVLWLPVETPIAYSIAGRPALVVASEGLRQTLDPDAVTAVLAHERAHIRGRHHLFVAVAESLAFAFARLPLMAQSPALVRTLVEMDADTHAARLKGEGCVRRALRGIQPHLVPPASLSISGNHDIELRIQRLELAQGNPATHSQAIRGAAAFSGTLLLTALPALALVAETLLASCDLL